MTTLNDRVRGCIYGSAIGDAIGAANEFLPKDQIERRGLLAGMVPGPCWEKGEWTDDTALMLCVAAAYATDTFNPVITAQKMIDWLASNPKDVGVTTRNSISKLALRPLTLNNIYELNSILPKHHRNTPTNGSVMRCAPTGVARKSEQEIYWDSEVLSSLTHQHDDCRGACVAVNLIVSSLVHSPKKNALDAVKYAQSVIDKHGIYRTVYLVLDHVMRCSSDWLYAEPHTIMGHALLCLERAVYTLLNFSSYNEGILWIANEGGDSDTNAAVAGALLGARFGASTIDNTWMQDVRGKDLLDEAVKNLTKWAKRA